MQDLLDMQQRGERHINISLLTLHDLVIEMGYVNRVKNLTINRRISLSFRDGALYRIFTVILKLSQNLT